MKKRVLYSTAVLATLAMASCSKDDVTNVATSGSGANQVIEIAVENAGDGLSSRAGRPLYSSEAKQSIENVKIIVCDEGGNVKADTLITNWNTDAVSEVYSDASGHGRKVRFTLGNGGSNDELAKETSYTVYAFGYHTGSQYKKGEDGLDTYLKKVGNGKKWNSGVQDDNNESVKTFSKDFTVTNLSDDNAEEIFAGSTEITVDENGNFSQGVTLHRQVAGMFTYVYKIPYFKTARYLKVYAVKENQNLVMGNFYSKVLGGNGINNVQENVVNGTNASEARTLIYQMDLNNWFKSIKDVNNDGIIDTYGYTYSDGALTEDKASANWQKPNEFSQVSLVKGSVFGGEFLIPFAAVADSKTFALELTDESGTVLRYWNINLPSTEVIDSGSLTTWGTADWTTTTSVTESVSSYSVLRNHLYGVGVKTKDDTSDPEGPTTDPEDPKDDEDDPQDLATKQDILLQVNDNWEVIHHMEVD